MSRGYFCSPPGCQALKVLDHHRSGPSRQLLFRFEPGNLSLRSDGGESLAILLSDLMGSLQISFPPLWGFCPLCSY